MGRQEEFRKERIRKLEELRKQGTNPYPQLFDKQISAMQLQDEYAHLKPEQRSKKKVKTAGRLMSFRKMGKIAFGTLVDDASKIQIVLQEGETPAKVFEFFKKYIDSGDFIGVIGEVFRTKRGEISILVQSAEILSKALAPLPDKWHGLEDKEERYRKRYIDLIMNETVKEVFRTRAKIIDTLRAYLKEERFLEVETPTLQSVYGGASAAPFTTHLNALDIELYLSISPELYLKRLIVGGYERVFTICKNFRNEGIDRQHNPEFTMLEYYASYQNYEYHMHFTQELFKRLMKALNISDEIDYQGKKIHLKTPFKRIKFRDLLLQETGIDLEKADSFAKLKKEIDSKKIADVDVHDAHHYGALLDELYKRAVRPKIIQPTFLTHYPVEMIALAKRNEENPRYINSVQLIIDGAEIVKAYDELNDPIDQERRLKEQAVLLQEGDAEAMPMDQDFIEALQTGMPPTAGYGLGIDRLTMLLTNSASIRDVLLFPFMKPLEQKTAQPTEVKKEVKRNGRFDRKK